MKTEPVEPPGLPGRSALLAVLAMALACLGGSVILSALGAVGIGVLAGVLGAVLLAAPCLGAPAIAVLLRRPHR